MSKFFQGRRVLIASMHGKENVIAPVLERLGMLPVRAEGFDTDRFGTFSGEVERQGDPLDALRSKCIAAFEETGVDLVVASEGSFGPHPSLYFIPADDELIMLKDFRDGREICVRELSTATNFGYKEVTSEEELFDFAYDAGFPTHAMILSIGRDNLVKGITSRDELSGVFQKYRANGNSPVRIETDMRALYNPSRMLVIAEAAEKLFHAVSSECPVCSMPDFSIRKLIPGLPCSQCGFPTTSPKGYVRICNFCDHHEAQPNERVSEDPMYCNFCNP